MLWSDLDPSVYSASIWSSLPDLFYSGFPNLVWLIGLSIVWFFAASLLWIGMVCFILSRLVSCLVWFAWSSQVWPVLSDLLRSVLACLFLCGAVHLLDLLPAWCACPNLNFWSAWSNLFKSDHFSLVCSDLIFYYCGLLILFHLLVPSVIFYTALYILIWLDFVCTGHLVWFDLV